MKTKLLILLSFFLVQWVSAEVPTTTLDLPDYKVTFPSNWGPMTQQQLDPLVPENNFEYRNYANGYISARLDDSGMPFMLIQFFENPMSQQIKIEEAIQTEIQTLKKAGIVGPILRVSDTKSFYMVDEKPDQKIYRGFVLCGNGTLYVRHYTRADDELGKQEFMDAFTSIEPKTPHVYKPAPPGKSGDGTSDSNGEEKKSPLMLVIIGVVGLAALLILGKYGMGKKI